MTATNAEPVAEAADLAPEPRARDICPYLLSADRRERRPVAWRGHRCTAVEPAGQLALDKQRRLCLVAEHATCDSFLAARPTAGAWSAATGAATGPDLERVTRWSFVRTTPTVLEPGTSVGGFLGRFSGSAVQAVLAATLIVALLAVGAASLRPGGLPAASPSTAASAVANASSSLAPSPSPTAASTPTATIAPTATPLPTPSPAPTEVTTYVVKSGDSLWAISVRFGTTVRALQDLNGLGNNTTLHVGQVLKIP